ncbi:hypothetical protein BHU24_07795 [Bacillus pseudomycoides]|jgi:hypothetical protein|uniref:hypothetical protein n=1 Tax=Bacillus TaxID=1386 RepID=UPI0011554186|nr:hypothetical protein [Bacillus pseudomycoides]MBD5798047.1 hypothetical protein [Bacillus pseudomycoides]
MAVDSQSIIRTQSYHAAADHLSVQLRMLVRRKSASFLLITKVLFHWRWLRSANDLRVYTIIAMRNRKLMDYEIGLNITKPSS